MLNREVRRKLKKYWDLSHEPHQERPEYPKGTIHFLSDDDTAYAFVKNRTLFIVCDGSDVIDEKGKFSLREWFENLAFWRTCKFGLVYGFGNAAEDFMEQIQEDIKLFPEFDRIVVIGHSRGGTIGFGLSLMLIDAGLVHPNALHLFTFGAPKPGGIRTKRWARKLGLNHTRVRIKGDWVTGMPPFSPLLPFIPYLHYQTEKIVLEVEGKGIVVKHKGYGKALSE